MNFVHLQTILSRRHSGKRKFSQNKRFPTVKGFTVGQEDSGRFSIIRDIVPLLPTERRVESHTIWGYWLKRWESKSFMDRRYRISSTLWRGHTGLRKHVEDGQRVPVCFNRSIMIPLWLWQKSCPEEEIRKFTFLHTYRSACFCT